MVEVKVVSDSCEAALRVRSRNPSLWLKLTILACLASLIQCSSNQIEPRNPSVPILDWAATVEELPDPQVVKDPEARRRIAATNLPWRVRDRRWGVELLLVPPGSYLRGRSAAETNSMTEFELGPPCECTGPATPNGNDIPQHRVVISRAFYLGRYEVTESEWVLVMGREPDWALVMGEDQVLPDELAHSGRIPMGRASFYAIAGGFRRAYSESFLGRSGFRLPTEAEWEYACRAGTTTLYHWGPSATSLEARAKLARYDDPEAAPVGTFPANDWGFHDMVGNQDEWCSDWYNTDEYKKYPDGAVDPCGPGHGAWRVLRGGRWNSRDGFSSSRATTDLDFGCGFRVARDP